MKRPSKVSIVSAMSILCSIAAAQSPPPDANVQGTWELVTQKTGNAQTIDVSKSSKRKEIKLIVDGHFVWTVYDLKRRTPDVMGGGTYRVIADSYIEHLEFASSGLFTLVGHEQKFKVRVDGDRLVQSGVLSDGTALEQTWERIH